MNKDNFVCPSCLYYKCHEEARQFKEYPFLRKFYKGNKFLHVLVCDNCENVIYNDEVKGVKP